MPPAARLTDVTDHVPSLNTGPCSPDVHIGDEKAWRALPEDDWSGLEKASKELKTLNQMQALDPETARPYLTEAEKGLKEAAENASSHGNQMAASVTASAFATLVSKDAELTATYRGEEPVDKPAAMKNYADGIHDASQIAAALSVEAIGKLSDQTNCPQVWIIIPHGPGVITKGAPSVFFNDLPAAREEDVLYEAIGGPDPVAKGFPTVIIGDEEKCGATSKSTNSGTNSAKHFELSTAKTQFHPVGTSATATDTAAVSEDHEAQSSFGDYARAFGLGFLEGAAFTIGLIVLGLVVGAIFGSGVGVAVAGVVGLILAALGIWQLVQHWDELEGRDWVRLAGCVVGGLLTARGLAGLAKRIRVARVRGKTSGPKTNAMSPRVLRSRMKAARTPSRTKGLTKAGHAFDKHAGGQRPGKSRFPKLKGGNAQKNLDGARLVERILKDPNRVERPIKSGRAKGGIEVIDAQGRGVRFGRDGGFIGFAEF